VNYTIRPNTTGAGWAEIERRQDLPSEIAEVRLSARPKLIDHETAAAIDSWIKRMGWALHDAPVFLEPLD
jgi:hypothetical protein